MTPAQLAKVADHLEAFLNYCLAGMGRRERLEALRNYMRGLLLDGERKSMEPIAERLVGDPALVQAMRQRMQEAVSVAQWDEATVFQRIALRIEAVLPVQAFVLDDTGFPKKGYASVGVQRQYSGTMGRIDNCQVATTLHLASEDGGACIGARLYLPRTWADDSKRRAKARIPDGVQFEEKWRLAIALLDQAIEWGLRHPVVADAGYGDSSEFRAALVERDLQYVLGISGSAVVWPPGVMPQPPSPKQAGTRGPAQVRWRDGGAQALSIAELAASLPQAAWHNVTWREGTRGPQSGRFAALRIRTAHRHSLGEPPGDEQWLLCEWPRRASAPTTFYLSNLSSTTLRRRLVYLAKIRWRIERDYQELKGELGLDHFEGRRWGGFHHHIACVAAAHAFLTLERALSPPGACST